jgi:hypothetical protein
MKPFICNERRLEHAPPRESPSEPALMSIRRDLLMRSALLRLPDLTALRALAAAKPAETPARRRGSAPRPQGRAAAPAKGRG